VEGEYITHPFLSQLFLLYICTVFSRSFTFPVLSELSSMAEIKHVGTLLVSYNENVTVAILN
jgi:hypothetical protein